MQQTACLMVKPIMVGKFAKSSLIASRWVGHQILWRFWYKKNPNLSIDERNILIFTFLSTLSIHSSLVAIPWEKLTSWLSCMLCFLVVLLLSRMVSWVRWGRSIWLYRFLIFAFFFNFLNKRCGPFSFSAGNHQEPGHSKMIRVFTVLLYYYLLSCK